MNDFRESSTLSRMQERYWATKRVVFKKFGKKDDDCIIASDAELDAKLELFQTIEESFLSLMRILENYQDRLCSLAQEENALGRFLKENGKYDKTRAGKVMTGAGKAMSFSAQQKLSLRLPLVRLYHEVETFQYRAIVDCLQTVEKMEKARTSYRGALMWMKDVSQQLDPDTCKQLEKFRKVQSNVRKTKARFDKLKLDTLQKVDLLSFSRCNLFSQALASYQNTLKMICEKVCHTMTSVAETTKGYQHYEFSELKELTETSKKLAEETEKNETEPYESKQNFIKTDDKDVLLFFESEYHDDDMKQNEFVQKNSDKDKLPDSNMSRGRKPKKKKTDSSKVKEKSDATLLDIASDNDKNLSQEHSHAVSNDSKSDDLYENSKSLDLLSGFQNDSSSKSELELLNEILDDSTDLFSSQFCRSSNSSQVESNLIDSAGPSCFYPSQLLDSSNYHISQNNVTGYTSDISGSLESGTSNSLNNSSVDKNPKGKNDMSSWYNLFADLDPLANPDLVGKKQVDEINC